MPWDDFSLILSSFDSQSSGDGRLATVTLIRVSATSESAARTVIDIRKLRPEVAASMLLLGGVRSHHRMGIPRMAFELDANKRFVDTTLSL